MRFAIASEGKTDYIVLKNLLVGFFKDKNLPITALRPKNKEPFGWGNLLEYIATPEFREDCDDDNIDHIVIQIDSNECSEWAKGSRHIGSDEQQLDAFVECLSAALIERIGIEFYETQKHKIIFAICVHEMECWLLPFNTTVKAHTKKMVGCFGTMERICAAKGFSLNQKNYEDGKHYDVLSMEMKDYKKLIKKGMQNPSLATFITDLQNKFNNSDADATITG